MTDVIQIARELIAIPSVNPMGSGASGGVFTEKHVAAFVAAVCRRLGMDTEITGRDPEHPNVVASIDLGRPETVLLEAHMDTVSHEHMEIEPFDPVIKEGLLFGRGSCDTKGSLAAYLGAITGILQRGQRLTRNVIVAGVHDEEYSFGGSRELLDRGLRATFAIAGEPTSLSIIHAHKGVCRFHITALGTAAHAALPWLGENAIYLMADVIHELRAHAADLQETSHPELGVATLNVGRIAGGEAVNIVPPTCRIDVDRRLLPGESAASATASIRARLDRLGGGVAVDTPYMEAPGLFTPTDSLACQALLRAAASAGSASRFQGAPYGTDASILSAGGIPTVVFGPGSVDVAHTKREYVPLQELELATAILTSLLTQA